MYSARIIPLLMVALSATTVTQAAFMDVELFGGVHHEGAVKRQGLLSSLLPTEATPTPSAAATSASASEEPTTSATDATTTTEPTPTTTNEPSTTDATSPTSEPTTTATQDPTQDPTTTTDGQTTTTEASPTTGPTTTNGPTSTTSTGGGAGGNSDTSTTADPTTTSAPPPSSTLSSYTSVVTEVTVVTTQDSNGQQTTFQTSTTRTSTGASLVTSQPDTSNNPSMAQDTRNIIIGVTVGVGGAIVLGVAGLLFWRLRSKRRSNEESEDLVSYGNGFGGPGTAEKSEAPANPGGRSPFQSTLESYHAPTQTNAASNF